MQLDMTKGNPWGLIIRFLIPVAIGNFFQQLYNTVDSIIVGRFVGVDALAAVGSTGTIMFLILGFLGGLTQGLTVLVSQRFGAGDEKGLKRAVGNAAVLAIIVCVIMTALSMIFMKPLLKAMNTPENIFNDAYSYIMIICAGIFGIVLYNMMAALLRAVGSSQIPLYFLIISVTLNCALDLIFIITFHMGVSGAAYATVCAQTISGALCFFYVYKKMPLLHPGRGNVYLEKKLSRQQLGIGIPMALQFSVTAIGTIVLQSALNLLGSIAVAAYTAAYKIEQVVLQPFLAMGATMATFSAQNMGIGNTKRIREGVRVALIISIAYALIMGVMVVTVLFGCVRLFVTGDQVEQVMQYASVYMHITAACYVPLSVIFVYRNALQGAGYGFLPMMGGVVEMVCRCIFSYIAVLQGSFNSVCIAYVSAWFGASSFLLVSYYVKMRKIEKEF